MYMSITLDGVTYNGKISKTDDAQFAEMQETMKDNMSEMTYMHLELENGDFLIIGKEAVQKAAIIFHRGCQIRIVSK